MATPDLRLEDLIQRLRGFADARDWHQYHTPKNLVMALAGEVGELTALFQWLTPEESVKWQDDPELAENVRDELADVMIYLVRLADVLGVDLLKAAEAKSPASQWRASRAVSLAAVKPENVRKLERRIATAGHTAVAEHRQVAPIDVFIGIGWLAPADVDRWRRGQVPYLERVATANLKKLGVALRALRRWAETQNLSPRHMPYRAQTGDRRQLRFSKSGDRNIERAYSTHWVQGRS